MIHKSGNESFGTGGFETITCELIDTNGANRRVISMNSLLIITRIWLLLKLCGYYSITNTGISALYSLSIMWHWARMMERFSMAGSRQ